MDVGMKFGGAANKEDLENLTGALLRILDAKADQQTIREALAVLGRSADMNNLSVSNCTIVGDTKHDHYHYSEPDAGEDSVDEEV